MATKRSLLPVRQRVPDLSIVRGTIVGFKGNRAIVVLGDGPANGVECEVLAQTAETLHDLKDGATGLVALSADDSAMPVLLGVIGSGSLPALIAPRIPTKTKRNVVVDGETVIFEAQFEIVLRCGKSEIILTRDGKIVIKGKDVVTRAAQNNRIKGTTVKIN
jgi:hypothetical protein